MNLRSPVVFLVAVGAAALSACSRGQAARADARNGQDKSVSVVSVREEPVRRSVEVVGTLAAQDEVTLSSEAEGAVSRLDADLGDRVKTGAALIELDREKSQYRYDQAKAAYEQALAKYGVASPGQLPAVEDYQPAHDTQQPL